MSAFDSILIVYRNKFKQNDSDIVQTYPGDGWVVPSAFYKIEETFSLYITMISWLTSKALYLLKQVNFFPYTSLFQIIIW